MFLVATILGLVGTILVHCTELIPTGEDLLCGATALVPVGDGVGLHGCLHLIWGGGDGGAHLVGYIHGAL